MLEFDPVRMCLYGLRQTDFDPSGRRAISMGLLLLIILILLLVGSVPTWPYSRQWGYGPSGGLGVLLAILIILMLLDYVPRGF
jgi:hypothetical protein